jgi:molecular chaperone HtpG
MAKTERFEFQSQAREVLNLMVYSVYSNKEIFLRELISNASDALDKLRLEVLKNPDLVSQPHEPEVRIDVDDTVRSLAVRDNGIGMSREEMIEYLGTIARSGTREFVKAIQEAPPQGGSAADLIGQFGVGFYSAFMVAGRVQVLSRKAGAEEAWLWDSTGDGTYTMEPAARDAQGTTVTLFLKTEDELADVSSYLQEWTIKGIVRKYSDFIAWPIRMEVESWEYPTEEEESDSDTEKAADRKASKKEPKRAKKLETLNSMKAIWTRPEKEVTDEEYSEFYRHLTRDSADPLRRIVFKAEGTSEFRSVLFFPSRAPFNLYYGDADHGVDLYIRKVFIMHDCKELVPFYLRFVKGVVDSDDLPLNVSREILQQDPNVSRIQKNIVRKVLNALKDMKDNDLEKYRAFWKEFGAVLKEGLFQDRSNQETLLDLVLLDSTASDTQPTTLADYVSRMPEGQEAIYYLTGRSRKAIEGSPHLEALGAKGYEVLLLSHPVDELWVQSVFQYKEKPFRNAAKGDLKLSETEKDDIEKKDDKDQTKETSSLLKALQGVLEEQVKEVRFSGRLTKSPACLVGDTFDMTPQMEAMMKAMGQEIPESKRILELNETHPLVERLSSLYVEGQENPRINDYARLLHGFALLSEGSHLPDPGAFARLVEELMVRDIQQD